MRLFTLRHILVIVAFTAGIFLIFVFVYILTPKDIKSLPYRYETSDIVEAEEVKYLSFQIFIAGPGFSQVPDSHIINRAPDPKQIEKTVKDIVNRIGTTGADDRRLGFTLGPLTLDMPDEETTKTIRDAFVIAQKYDIAVSFHIEDSKFWSTRTDLSDSVENVEWLDWDRTPSTAVYLNWGEVWRISPQICFNAQEVQREVKRRTHVIGAAIAEEVEKLHAEGKDHLYAGTIVGWETAINPEFDDRTKRLGYCALTNAGFSKSNPPHDFEEELEKIVVKWIELWTRGLIDSDLTREKLYSHITFKPKVLKDEGGGDYGDGSLYVNVESAFGDTHNPGFSLYTRRETFEEIYDELEARNNPRWALSEGANIDIYRPPVKEPRPEGMEAYLARFFNHGASLVNIFGWDVGDRNNPFRVAATRKEALVAYKKFLNGEELRGFVLEDMYGPLASDIGVRVERLPETIKAYELRGGDLRKVEPLAKELARFAEQGDLENLVRLLEKIEAIVER